jgi:glutamate racemase
MPDRTALPVGVFDSGWGGLSVLAEIRRILPCERLAYVADSAYVPYGPKPSEFIRDRSFAIAGFLAALPVKALVVACNTATAAALAELRAAFPFPIVGMEPAVKPAVSASRSGIVGVLATTGTLESARFAALLERYAGETTVLTQPCEGLVEQVEAGALETPETLALVQRYTRPLVDAGADTLILGCTHYPFLRAAIARCAGPDVRLVDTGEAVARRLRQVLAESASNAPPGAPGEVRFWSSAAERAPVGLSHLWPDPPPVAPLPRPAA